MSIEPFLRDIARVIINPIIGLAFVIALLVFFWGIFQFVRSETVDDKREDGKRKILWGLFGMFIMISAYGLIHLVLNTLGLTPPDIYPLKR